MGGKFDCYRERTKNHLFIFGEVNNLISSIDQLMKEVLHTRRLCTVVEEFSECVSSTYLCTKQSGLRSLISTKNERGPSQESCGIALFSQE